MKQKKTTQTFRKHSTGKVQQPRKTERYHTEKIETKTAQGRVSHRESSTTEDKRKIANREDRKETAQGQVSHRETSTTEDNRKVSQRQDRNETAQGQVSQGQGSSTENNWKVSHREDGKEISQGQVSPKQGSTTGDRKIDIAQRRKWKET